MLTAFSRGCWSDSIHDLVFANDTCGNMGKKGTVVPDIDPNSISMCGRHVFACFRDRQSRTRALHPHSIDEVTGWQVPNTNDRVHGCGDNPAAVIREAKVVDLAKASPELTDNVFGLGVNNSYC